MKGLRVARTRDGRYVLDTDPAAVVLAYNQHDDVPEDVLAQVKQARKPADKQMTKPADKSVPPLEPKALEARRPPASGPGSGAPEWRRYAAAVTGTPAEEWAELGRDEIVKLLPADNED